MRQLHCRETQTPALLQADTYRFHRHFVAERPKPVDYIVEEEHLEYISRDPLFNFSSTLGFDSDRITKLTISSTAIVEYIQSD